MDALLVDLFLESREAPPAEIVLDVDATDDPVHGGQEGRFFSGHYDCYCYLPLYVFCGGHLLCARLRSASVDAADGTVGELERIVSRIRARWPAVRIAVRGDGGFCREEIMAWCEAAGVDYAFGLAKNSRLTAMAAAAMYEARVMHEMTGEAQRVFDEMRYRTRGSWSRARRVVAKAEHNGFGANPRFVVTSVGAGEWDCQALYEDFYCARGDMENRIKEQQLDLFADRTSTARMHANQVPVLRLVRLRADADAAPGGAGGHRTRQGAMRDHPGQGAQGRCPGAGERAPGLPVVRGDVAARGAARGGARQLEDDAASLLRSRADANDDRRPPGVRRAPPAAARRKSAESRRNQSPNHPSSDADARFPVRKRLPNARRGPPGRNRRREPATGPANARW